MPPTQETWEATTATAEGASPLTGHSSKRALFVQLAGAEVGALYNVSGTLVIGRGSDADVRIEGAGISRHHARVRLAEERVEFEDLGSTNGSFVNGRRVQRKELSAGDKIQLGSGTVLGFGYQDETDANFHRLMFEFGSREAVTGLCNQRFFLERLATEFAFAVRHETPLLLIAFQVCGLRAIERDLGADATQRLLGGLGKTIGTGLRTEDVLAHFGDGLFALLSRGVELGAASALCDRLRAHTQSVSNEIANPDTPIALAFGSAGLPNQSLTTPEALLKMSQRALTRA